MDRSLFAAGALLALLGVAAGAFGAHALAERLTPDRLAIFEIGVRYQMYHALGLLALGLAAGRWPGTQLGTAGMFMLGGVLIFSGTLYAMAFGAPRWLGAITPIGGVGMILGWAIAVWAVLRGGTGG
jgi:uncharacterized membrane protein YgdD (TMEM256/DUF423 family)